MLKVRQADMRDLEVLVQLRLELLREIGTLEQEIPIEDIAKAIRQYLIKKIPIGEFVAWIAEVEGQIVGISGLVFFERPPYGSNLAGLEAYIMNIYTIPEWRDKGIATTLLTELINFVKGTAAKRIWLHASDDGKSIYEKAGFLSTEIEMELML